MRPVNLIPPEERRGDSAPARTGAIGYVIIGLLVLAVGVVAWMTLLGKQIDDNKAKISSAEAELQQSQARANALEPYVSLASVRQARTTTIDSLAKSRFDWERVLRELARVTPDSISLSALKGTVSPEVTVDGSPEVALRATVPGPALEIAGCARDQRSLAEYINALQDIDGVTRVAAEQSVRGEKPKAGEAAAAASSAGGGDTCANSTDAAFTLVAAFDAIAVPAEGALDSTSTVTSTTTATTPATGATAEDGGVAAAQTQQDQQQAEISRASSQSNGAIATATGG